MPELLKAFLADRRGATAIEYGLICALIFLVIITSVSLFGEAASNLFINATDTVREAIEGGGEEG